MPRRWRRRPIGSAARRRRSITMSGGCSPGAPSSMRPAPSRLADGRGWRPSPTRCGCGRWPASCVPSAAPAYVPRLDSLSCAGSGHDRRCTEPTLQRTLGRRRRPAPQGRSLRFQREAGRDRVAGGRGARRLRRHLGRALPGRADGRPWRAGDARARWVPKAGGGAAVCLPDGLPRAIEAMPAFRGAMLKLWRLRPSASPPADRLGHRRCRSAFDRACQRLAGSRPDTTMCDGSQPFAAFYALYCR